MKLLGLTFLAAQLAATVLGKGFWLHREQDEDGPWLSPGPYDDDNKPILKLPYGTFEASETRDKLWRFKDIPYAAPPVGDLRWEKPVPPKQGTAQPKNSTLPFQIWMDNMTVIETPSDPQDTYHWPKHYAMEIFGRRIGEIPEHGDGNIYGEDCLTLDVLVPEKALKNPHGNIPVVVFIYGETFMGGGKERAVHFVPLYDGHALVEASGDEVIYVVFNYRMGAFGFLGGTTTEQQAVPNVGLWDQRAVFQWVQDYIHVLGGDPKEVTAMGHAAGASSIMFHLSAEGGTLDPLFKYAIMVSPTYTPIWDRRGHIEDRYKDFERLAGCEALGFDCLRTRSSEQLQYANQEVALREVPSAYAFGPVPDGAYIRQLPMLEWAQGNIWPVEKVIMTHTSMETGHAVNVDTSAGGWSFSYLASLLPHRDIEEGWIDEILHTYPFWSPMDKPWHHYSERYRTEVHRMQTIMLHTCFTCHMRWLTEALGEERVYLVYWSIYPFFHGADLLALFWPMDFPYRMWKKFYIWSWRRCDSRVSELMPADYVHQLYDTYKVWLMDFVKFKGDASTGNRAPAGHPVLGTPENNDAQLVKNVLGVEYKPTRFEKGGHEPHQFFQPMEIGTMPKGKCDFWMDLYRQASENGNYTVSD